MSERPVELPAAAEHWSADERDRAERLLAGQAVVVNVRRGGPHRRLVPWLVDTELIVYIGHSGNRHDWPASDFANPFVREAKLDRDAMVRHYRDHLDDRPDLRARLGELRGRALGCWCAPQPCHGDVLLAALDEH